MVHPNHLHIEMLADLDPFMIIHIHLMVFGLKVGIFLLHIFLQHTDGKTGRVDRRRNLLDQMVKGTNMIKVSVSNDHRLDLIFSFFQIGDIRHDVVNSGVIVTRKEKAHVDNDNLVTVFESSHVFTDAHLTVTADRDNPHCRLVLRLLNMLASQRRGVLLAGKAVVERAVDRSVDDMLTGLSVDVVADTTFRPLNFTSPGSSSVKHGITRLT